MSWGLGEDGGDVKSGGVMGEGDCLLHRFVTLTTGNYKERRTSFIH